MRRLTPKDYRPMPWRNGGGTMEIAREPLTSARFLYRASIADVATDGPFSSFAGYDRHILLIEGEGMTLDCGARGCIALTSLFVPRSFSGDWEVHGTLAAGPVRDFNLMVDRAEATSSLEVHRLEAPLELAEGALCLVHVLEGSLEGADLGDTLVGETPFSLTPRPPAARVAIARIVRRSAHAV
jgi:environmental stress-induced protein Ves